MNRRERILAMAALAVVILAGGGFLFKFLFLDALALVQAQIAAAQTDIDNKKAELSKEETDQQTIKRRDPRLSQWQHLSLPDDKNLSQEIKNGHTPEEAQKRHEDIVQVEYEQFLRDLVVSSGFSQNSIKVSAATDRKGGPILTGKTPAYTKMSFTVQGQAGFDSVVRMLEDFYHTPLLHEVRSLTLTSKPQQTRPAAPGGFAPPGGLPGALPGGFPGRPGGFAGAAPGGLPGVSPAVRGAGDLDVSMTVEALLVTGADKRDALLPDSTGLQVHALADPARHYTDMLAKNMFTGVAAESKLTEDRATVLNFVKLTSIWNNGRRWQATFYDQGKGGDEKHLKPPVLDEFSVADKYDNVLVRAKVVKLDADGLIFQADDKYYRWRCGEMLGPVMETPLNSSELKVLGVKTASASDN